LNGPLFLFTPKWIFTFGPDHLAQAKSIEERPKKKDMKQPKKNQKTLQNPLF
jgi:hypothetical protein